MMQKRLWLGAAAIALIATPASAQYVTRYQTSDKPSVEINLEVLHERQEQEYNAQSAVTAEPLPAAQPPRLVAPAPEVVAEEEQPAPAPRKRLLKPILTARTPQPEQAQITQEEMQTPLPVVKRSELPAYAPEDEELENEMAAEEPAPKQPKPVKRSWSAVDNTPPPDDMPQPPQTAKAEPTPKEPVIEETAVAMAELETKKAEPVVAAVEEPAAEPVAAKEPEPEPKTVLAEASHVTSKGNAIISHRPRYSDEAPRPEPVPAPAQPVVTQMPPETQRPSLVVVDTPPSDIPTPLPSRKPQVIEPTALTTPPIISERPEIETTPEPDVTATEPPQEPVAETMPVVPTLADLTLNFNGSSSDLNADSQKKLDGVTRQLAESIEGRLQVRGYAVGEDGSQTSAKRIALSRALAVRAYLMDKGIKPNRVDVQAKGAQTDRQPVDRVDLIFAK